MNRPTPIENYTDSRMPILFLNGSLAGISKDDAVTLNYTYLDRSGTCTLKWQGSSSIGFKKKNYTIKFDNAFEVVDGWDEQKKYCLKANFADCSHARNLICAKLWGQFVKSRTTKNQKLNTLPNGGAVDGFPIIISLNGEFHGLYTWNIPKDDWLFGMTEEGQQAILCADALSGSNDSTLFKELATFSSDFELEYSSDEQSDWVLESLNRLISAVMDSDGTNIEHGITPYIDWDSAIDYFIHTVLTTGYDGIARNYILATYDGVKWFFSAYDMDTTFGAASLGKYFIDVDNTPNFSYMAQKHKLFGLIWKYMRPQLRARYNALKTAVFAEHKVAKEFYNFASLISKQALDDDLRLYGSIPSSVSNTTEQILNYYRMRLPFCDEWIANTSGETQLPTQEQPEQPEQPMVNQIPISIDTDGSVFNGTGFQNGYRLSSSGAAKAQEESTVTGYIPAKGGDIIRMSGFIWRTNDHSMNYLCAYDSSFTFIGAVVGNNTKYSTTIHSAISNELDSNYSEVTLANLDNIAYIRVSSQGSHDHVGVDFANSIITVNQTITT